jgi:hypothetical protein
LRLASPSPARTGVRGKRGLSRLQAHAVSVAGEPVTAFAATAGGRNRLGGDT